MPDECDEDDCERSVHTNMNGITMNKCTKHFLQSMSDLRPNAEFSPQ